jgi:Zn ribbon nucleic-acid-binding protein
MAPVGLDHSGKKGWIIIHECTKCGHTMKNKSAEDDSQDEIAKLGKEC